ncbi:MAG: energy-coupling factor ABC transporter ATP-binding protein [Armatimonadota bacterium]
MVESKTIFRLERVGYRYPDGVTALEDVSFTVRAGDRIAVLGANGCGKSTLLRLLDALIFPAEGRIFAYDTELTPSAVSRGDFALQFRRRVGLVFQDPDVQLFSPTVEEEIAFGPRQLAYPEDEVNRRVGWVLERLGITPLRRRPPYRLSGGEKRKVAIASVLCLDPEVLLLDEPTSDLDARSQGALLDLIWELGAEGKTILAATHDLSIVHEIADRAYILGEDHRLLAEGPPEQVLSDEALLVKANLVHIHSHRHDGQRHSHPHDHRPPHVDSGLPHDHPHADGPPP